MRCLLLSLAALLLAGSAQALSFTADFTASAWNGANGTIAFPPIPTTSFTVTNVDGSGVDVTVQAVSGFSLINNTVDGPPPAPPPGPGLANGLGIANLLGDTDITEVSDAEILRVIFSMPVTTDSILFSKLFTIASGKDNVDETAMYSLNGGPAVTVTAFSLDPEGRHNFAVGVSGVTMIDFTTIGGDHDYSIVNVAFSVPEPSLLALLGCAGLLLAGSRRTG